MSWDDYVPQIVIIIIVVFFFLFIGSEIWKSYNCVEERVACYQRVDSSGISSRGDYVSTTTNIEVDCNSKFVNVKRSVCIRYKGQ